MPENLMLRKFLSRMVVNEKSGCWEWIAGKYPGGYGGFALHGKTGHAHRASYELHFGKIPDGMHVLHRCDNRPCVNPEHLFLGTQLDNIADKKAKERQAKGITHGSAKLTEQDVLDIRAIRGMSQRAIGRQYGIGQAQVKDIRQGRYWKHLLAAQSPAREATT